MRVVPPSVLALPALLPLLGHANIVMKAAPWYDGLEGVKVLSASDDPAQLQGIVQSIFEQQDGWVGHFTDKRFAILLTPGTYPEDFVIPMTYYTTVHGVGQGPESVKLKAVRSVNGANGHATNNFWRAFEGVHLWNETITWAVSQGASARRSIIDNKFLLSEVGYASGGFVGDMKVAGTVATGMQQQWLFRNLDVPGGVWCPAGWNFVFVGVKGMTEEAVQACAGAIPGKVTVVKETPRIAEKPYLVQASGGSDWHIYVPEFVASPSAGATEDHAKAATRRLALGTEVFVVKPGHTDKEITEGMKGKQGLLITPGVYVLENPIVVRDNGFVILGLGMATLVATNGKAAIEVDEGLVDVRVAGLLIEAGTPSADVKPAEALLRWGKRGSRRKPKGVQAGVLSDVYFRVGAFKYRSCEPTKADTMLEVNTDDVVLDNIWLWHADHDDCGTDPDNTLDVHGPSDDSYSRHGMVVEGDRVTAYGISAEHMTDGDMVSWRGDKGELYFYQAELPYHQDEYSKKGYVGYAVAPGVSSHTCRGLGVYIISSPGVTRCAYRLPASTVAENLVTMVVVGEQWQFSHTICLASEDDGEGPAYKASTCEGNRCVVFSNPGSARVERLFLDGPGPALYSSAEARVTTGLLLLAFAAVACGAGLALVKGGRERRWGRLGSEEEMRTATTAFTEHSRASELVS